MAIIRVKDIPNIPNGYQITGKKIMIHDLTADNAQSTKLIPATEFSQDLQSVTDKGNFTDNSIIIGIGSAAGVGAIAQGDNVSAIGDYSYAGGNDAVALSVSEFSRAGGSFVTAGDAQTTMIQLMGGKSYTQGNTAGTLLTIGGNGTSHFKVKNGYVFTIQYSYSARFSNNAAAFFSGVICGKIDNGLLNYQVLPNTYGSVVLPSSVITITNPGISLAVDSNNNLLVKSMLVSTNPQALDSREHLTMIVNNLTYLYPSTCIPVQISLDMVSPNIPIPIDRQINLLVGQEFSVNVDVTAGSGPVIYQWRKNGDPILNETSTGFTIEDPQVSDSGTYDVVVSNGCSSVISDPIILNIAAQTTTIYYGFSTQAQLAGFIADPTTLQHSEEISPGQITIEAFYSDNNNPRFLLMFEPKSEPIKSKWFGSEFNNGLIDVSTPVENLFTAIEVGSWRYYITAYPTQQTQTSIKFIV